MPPGSDESTCLLQLPIEHDHSGPQNLDALVFPAPAPPAHSLLDDDLTTDGLSPTSAQLKAMVAQPDLASDGEFCILPKELPQVLESTVDEVLKGLPQWNHSGPATVPDVRIAFLIQASFEEQLLLLARTFHHIYTPKDVYLYMVDQHLLHPARVRAMLPSPLPENVKVMSAQHADYFYWPRVEVVLNGYKFLLDQPWDFVIHLSESDYPLHTMDWIRATLAMQRQRDFIYVSPRCAASDEKGVTRDQWYWWGQNDAVATCGWSGARPVSGVHFQTERMEDHGFRFGRAPEWVVLTRELVQYAVSPELAAFRRFVSMHSAADEIFWATLVLNIPNYTHGVSPQDTYMSWRPGSNSHSPETLTSRHEDVILDHRQAHFFMRKVNRVDSSSLLAYVDELLAEPDVAPVAPVISKVAVTGAIPCPRS